MKKWFSQNWLIVLSGLVIGAAAVTLTALGNPGNMGFCIACFLRDTSGALGLHSAPVVQYFRPEIVGIVLGALIAAIAAKEFKGHGGSSPVLRFVLVIRLGGGDLNALVGLVGFIAGILVGIVFLKKGFSLQRSYRQMKAEGAAFPLVLVGLYVVYLLFKTAFKASEEGPGSMHAAIGVALAIGVIVGILCQRSRMCMVGGIRNSVMFRDFGLISGFLAILIAVIIGNLILGKFNLGFEGQPIAHTDGVWNFLGMALVGWLSVLLGGCPLRQLVLSGEGNSDAAMAVLGMLAGAAFCHNFGLASSADGPTANGKVAVIIGFVVALLVSLVCTRRAKE